MSEELEAGSVFGPYEIREELGRGGMGCVYRAHHIALARDVALKLLSERFSRDAAYLQRFLKEARAAARLNHPNIVQIYDFGQVGDAYYLAMEYVKGRSVGYYLRHLGRFTEPYAVAVTRHVCIALGVAHAAGIVHRDVKPDNVMLAEDGTVKLVDLGLARSLSDDQHLTQTGVVAGTPHYISPEQIAGMRDIDGRADIYSLGAMLFHLVTGQTPFPGSSPMVVIARHLHDEVPDPRSLTPELSEGLCAVIRRMMARDREARYPDVRSVDVDLYQLQRGGAPAGTAVLHAREVPSHRQTGESPVTTPAVAWDSGILRQLEERLAGSIGPMARVLVRKAAERATTLDELCRQLAQHIPSESERQTFLTTASSGDHGPAWRPASDPALRSATASDQAGSPGAPSRVSAGPAEWPPESLALLERQLAAAIGPVARVLVRKAARSAHSWDELVTVLAANLPTPAEQASFCSSARAVGH
ncbi:MAG: serine/threonine-protein kinase [Acidobacteriota bacterium]